MEKKNYGTSTLGNHRSLITHPVSDRVKEINAFIFENFAKKSITKFGFLPVLRLIEPVYIYIKLYYYPERVGRYRRQIEDFVATLYNMEIRDLSYSGCNIIKISMDEEIDKERIDQCSSMEELESLLLNLLNDDCHVGVMPDGTKGGLSVGGIHYETCKMWKSLLTDGNIKPGYDAWRELDIIKKGSEEKTQKVLLQLLMPTGGVQPTTLDSAAINNFYTGNVAKVWAMNEGFIPKFRSFEDGVIFFDLITDPRSEYVDHLLLCKYIAKSYEKNVTVLNGATSFEARHFIANDIIGFNLRGNDIAKLDAYNSRMQASYASLPAEPHMIHGGKIVEW